MDRAIALATGEERTATGVLPGGRFVTTPAAVSSQAVEEFYKTLDAVKTAKAGEKKGQKNELARWSVTFGSTERRLAFLRKQMRETQTVEAKNRAAEEILQTARRTMKNFRERQAQSR